MAKQKSSSFSSETLALYDAIIRTVPGIERKGDTVPYTSLNGNMFSALDSEGTLRIRLPKDVLETFLIKYKTKQPVSYGVLLKEYAEVPSSLLKKTAELKPYFKSSFDYVNSLKPKPTTKTKKK